MSRPSTSSERMQCSIQKGCLLFTGCEYFSVNIIYWIMQYNTPFSNNYFFQLTALVSALMAKLWCQRPDPSFLFVLSTLGPLAEFEGLLSLHGHELDMWGDMVVAVEDLSTVTFTLVHSSSTSSNSNKNRGPNSSDRYDEIKFCILYF